jgi:biopolymer transport protein ExbD
MPVIAPGRRPAFPPIGRLRTSPLSGGKKSGFVSLNLTAMVDMFTILVIFLIQMFKASGEVELSDRIKVPKTAAGAPMEEQGLVVQIDKDGQIFLDNKGFSPEELGSELDVTMPGMVTRLTERKEWIEKTEGKGDPSLPFQKYLLVQADIKTDFKIVRRTIASANEAGWARFKFISQPMKKDKGEGEGEAAEH